MKIAHIVCSYPPYYSGMGNVVFETVSRLVGLGHEVEVFTPGYYEDKELKFLEEPEEEVHREDLQERVDYGRRLCPSLQYGNAARLPQIAGELDRFDLVHLHYPFFGTANLVRKWKLKNPNKPLAITYHMDTRGPGWKGLIFKYYSKYWMPKILGSADKLIGSSFDYIESSDAGLLFNQNREKWVELPFGVDTERFKPREKPEALFERHNLTPDLPILLFVGGMDAAHYFKGIPVLLKALLLLKRQNFNVRAVFVGEGELRKEFALKAQGFGIKNNVRFVGRVEDEELPYYYNLADLLVLPSINQGEAFGMVLLEAMASGVPVVASNLPGMRKVAGEGGMVFEANNETALAQTIADYFSEENNIEEWGIGVRRVVEEKYSWDFVTHKLEEIYKMLLG